MQTPGDCMACFAMSGSRPQTDTVDTEPILKTGSTGLSNCTFKVQRSGGWGSGPGLVRATDRWVLDHTDISDSDYGFRLVLSPVANHKRISLSLLVSFERSFSFTRKLLS